MRSPRGSNGAEPSRAERADAAARRLALLAADLGAVDPDPRSEPRSEPWLAAAGDFTRVVPARRAVPPDAPGDVERPKPPAVPDPPVLPRPGRHAARRRMRWPVPRLPGSGGSGLGSTGLGAAQLTVVAVVVALGVALTAWWVVRDQATPVAPTTAHPPASAEPLVPATGAPAGTTASAAPGGGTVTVDVTGKVRRPGIVVLDTGARVVDALEAAGGERKGVDLSSLNLARVLVDGEQIVVGEPHQTVPAMPSGSAAPPGAPTTLVNLNTATQVELETLPDVGPVTALAILAWRDEHGGFTSVDELLEVDGIGETTLGNLAPYVTV